MTGVYYWFVTDFWIAIALVSIFALYVLQQAASALPDAWHQYYGGYSGVATKESSTNDEEEEEEEGSTGEGKTKRKSSLPSETREALQTIEIGVNKLVCPHKSDASSGLSKERACLLACAVANLLLSVSNHTLLITEGGYNVECSNFDAVLFLSHAILTSAFLYCTLCFTAPLHMYRNYGPVGVVTRTLKVYMFLLKSVLGVVTVIGTGAIALVGHQGGVARTCSDPDTIQSHVSWGFYLYLGIINAGISIYLLYLWYLLSRWSDPSKWSHYFTFSFMTHGEHGKTWRGHQKKLLQVLDMHYGGSFSLFIMVSLAYSVSKSIIILHNVCTYSIDQGWMAGTRTPRIPTTALQIWLDVAVLVRLGYGFWIYAWNSAKRREIEKHTDYCGNGEELCAWMETHPASEKHREYVESSQGKGERESPSGPGSILCDLLGGIAHTVMGCLKILG
jgi:hypothetical protein